MRNRIDEFNYSMHTALIVETTDVEKIVQLFAENEISVKIVETVDVASTIYDEYRDATWESSDESWNNSGC